MSKRLMTVLLTMLTVMLLTGCNANQKAATEAADGFLTAIMNNDKEAAAQYATEEFMNSETIKLMDPQYLSDNFFKEMNVSKEDLDSEAIETVDNYAKELVARAYQSYEIQDVKVQKNTASVTAKITLGYDPEASSQISDETYELISQYQTEHYDELIELYLEEGEKAMYRKLYSDLIPIVIGKMQEQIVSGGTSEEKTILTLEKIDKQWLVTSLEENRKTAADAVSEKEAAEAAAAAAPAVKESAAEDSTSAENAEEGSTSYEYAAEDDTSEEAAAE